MQQHHEWSGLNENALDGDAEFYLLDRMADPNEPVHLVGREDGEPARFEGLNRTRFIVETKRGVRFLVEPWQVSRGPPDKFYRRLRSGATSMRVLVVNVRLAG